MKYSLLYTGGEDPNTIFCAYCVTSNQQYLIAVCCDSQGELLDSTIIGLKYPHRPKAFIQRIEAFRSMWSFILSSISRSVCPYHVVITRLGRPSRSELSDLKELFHDLEISQKDLIKTCASCQCKGTSHTPKVEAVFITSFLPQSTYRVFYSGISLISHQFYAVLHTDTE